jgi:mannose-6-phosphate isomerase-like protein (cupin superfamily)
VAGSAVFGAADPGGRVRAIRAAATLELMEVVDALAHRGRFFRVLQETERSQTAVMTIAPGETAAQRRSTTGDQIVYVVEGEAILTHRRQGAQCAGGIAGDDPARTPHHVKNPGESPLLRDGLRAAGVLKGGRPP